MNIVLFFKKTKERIQSDRRIVQCLAMCTWIHHYLYVFSLKQIQTHSMHTQSGNLNFYIENRILIGSITTWLVYCNNPTKNKKQKNSTIYSYMTKHVQESKLIKTLIRLMMLITIFLLIIIRFFFIYLLQATIISSSTFFFW